MSMESFNKSLARYVNLRTALSIAITIVLTIIINNINGNFTYVRNCIFLTISLFIMWIVATITEKGGSGFATWLSKFFNTKQANSKEIELARANFIATVVPIKDPPIESPMQVPQLAPESTIPIVQASGYQTPDGG